MTPLDWYRLGALFAINGTAFLLGAATIAAIAIMAATAVHTIAAPAARKLLAIRARRRTWRTHHTSGRT